MKRRDGTGTLMFIDPMFLDPAALGNAVAVREGGQYRPAAEGS
jgi:hypothetical protein